MPGNAPRYFNHLPHAEALPCAEVVDQPAALGERIQGKQVRRSQIEDVDVVPNAAAIRRRVVCSEDRNARTLSERYFQDEWNQVRFRRMVFAQVRASCSGCVEVAQAGVA